MPRLRMKRGAVEEIFDLKGAVTTMGRSSENTILVEDKQSSRKHCQVERTEDGDWKLVDLESRNGTKVNGAVVNQHLLKDGDRIEIGDVALIFEADRLELLPSTATAQNAPAPGASPGYGGGGMAPRPMVGPRPPLRRSSSTSSTILAGFFALLILGGAFVAVKAISQGEKPERIAARQHWERGMTLRSNKDFAGALKEFEAIPPEQLDYYEKVQEEIPILKRAIEQEGQAAAAGRVQTQLEELQKYALENPDNLDGIQMRVDAFKKKFSGTPQVAEADAILNAALESRTGAQDKEFRTVTQAVEEMLRASEFTGACKALDEYASKYPASKSASEARDRKRGIVEEGQTWFQTRHAEGEEQIKSKKWNEARSVYDGIVKAFGEDANFFQFTLLARQQLDRIKKLEAEE